MTAHELLADSMTGREKEIIRHLSVDDLDRLLNETNSEKVSKRLTFVKRLVASQNRLESDQRPPQQSSS
jgi:hypothetical protein